MAQTNLPAVQRFITTHSEEGIGIFTVGDGLSEAVPWESVGGDKNYALTYTTDAFPARLDDDQDMKLYESKLQVKPGMVIRGGTVLRYVDYGPGVVSSLHRTISLDYGVVIEGQIECTLDSGEKKIMNRGDVCIMRATKHGWRNTSNTSWARVLFFMMDAEPPLVTGERLSEDYGSNMKGINASS